ncbi:MAG: phospho-N-acetylmuramoyl-pentapeptide-transferase [Opitutales bacterium]
MLTYLAEFEELFGPFRLFGYITFRAILGAGTALLIGFLLGPWLIRRLRRLSCQQSLRDHTEVGRLAVLHEGKKNTPTMGGLLLYVSVTASVLLWAHPNIWVLVALFVYTGLTVLGFSDDYLKVTKRNSKGVSGRRKLLWQGVIALVALMFLLWHPESSQKVRELWVPFFKEAAWLAAPIWILFPFFALILVGSSNAINLTDGIDGLAIGCTITVALVYSIMAYAAGHIEISEYLYISHVPGSGELAIVCACLVGAGLAFLWYNAHPAEVFMGDTGSLALGGIVGTVAFMVHQPLTLVIVGGIFVMEAMSVIIQVASFKIRGKRVFRMAPIHHHFELKEWLETKVVIRFWILSLIFAIIGLGTLKLR